MDYLKIFEEYSKAMIYEMQEAFLHFVYQYELFNFSGKESKKLSDINTSG